MKRNLAILFLAASFAGCQAITLLSTQSRTEVFASIDDGSIFGACLQTMQLAQAPGTSFAKACMDAFSKYGAQTSSITSDCSELAGRASEAFDEHFLGDGHLMCGRLVRERAFNTGRPLANFAPAQGGTFASAFCDVMKTEALSICAPASTATVVTPADSSNAAMLPPAAIAQAVPQVVPALRAAEAKPARLVAASAPQPQPQMMVATPQQAGPEPVVTPQMDQAAQTIAAGVFPAFARQVPQAMAAGLSSGLAAAPMNAKAEQQPDLNNGGIWSNLAALLHRTG
jgi:hypothetical protein